MGRTSLDSSNPRVLRRYSKALPLFHFIDGRTSQTCKRFHLAFISSEFLFLISFEQILFSFPLMLCYLFAFSFMKTTVFIHNWLHNPFHVRMNLQITNTDEFQKTFCITWSKGGPGRARTLKLCPLCWDGPSFRPILCAPDLLFR